MEIGGLLVVFWWSFSLKQSILFFYTADNICKVLKLLSLFFGLWPCNLLIFRYPSFASDHNLYCFLPMFFSLLFYSIDIPKKIVKRFIFNVFRFIPYSIVSNDIRCVFFLSVLIVYRHIIRA